MSLILVSAGPETGWNPQVLEQPGSAYRIRTCTSIEQLSAGAEGDRPAVVLIVSRMPTPRDLEQMRVLAQSCPRTPIVLACESLSPESAVRCARAGTTHVFSEPCSSPRLLSYLEFAIQEEEERAQALKADEANVIQPYPFKPLRKVVEDHLTQTLKACGGNRSKAAKHLGIDRSTLRRRLSEITPSSPANV